MARVFEKQFISKSLDPMQYANTFKYHGMHTIRSAETDQSTIGQKETLHLFSNNSIHIITKPMHILSITQISIYVNMIRIHYTITTHPSIHSNNPFNAKSDSFHFMGLSP